MKAVDVAGSEGDAAFHSTSTPKPVESKKNGYVNDLQRFGDLNNCDAAVADEDGFDVEGSDCGVGQEKAHANTIYQLTDEPKRNGISNGMTPLDIDDLKSGSQQPDVVLTNGIAAGKRSEANGGFYLLSNGRTKKSDDVMNVDAVHSVDLLNGEPGGAARKGGSAMATGTRLTEKGMVNGEESPTASWDRTAAEMKEHAFNRLQDELKKAQQELKLRDEEVGRLSRIREEVEAELEDLTASLFQEAHNMVREANVKQASAERAYKESEMKIEVLTAEVSALKALVLTSTPSKPNPHLHPQIDLRGNRAKDDSAVGGSLFNRSHRRSPSHFNLKYGRENSPPESPVKEPLRTLQPETLESKDGCEVDPEVHKEFVSWKENPKMDKSDPFVARVYREEINLCFDFPNKELSQEVRNAVETGNIFIEAVSDKAKTVFPKKCALLDVPRQCHYRMKFGDQDQWYSMSQICRNRIIAVCEFLNYLKYIERGLVKSSVHDVYWEVTRLRKEMVLARLGLALPS